MFRFSVSSGLLLHCLALITVFTGFSNAYQALINDANDLRLFSFTNLEEKARSVDTVFKNGSMLRPNPNSKCAKDLEYIVQQLNKLKASDKANYDTWTLDLLDSIGKIPSNIANGNVFWVGDFELCRNLKPKPEKMFKGRYCLSVWHQSSNPIDSDSHIGPTGLRLGICVPDSCSSHDITHNFDQYRKVMDFLPGANTLLKATHHLEFIQCLEPEKWTLSGIGCILCILLLSAVVLVATQKHRRIRREGVHQNNNNDNKVNEKRSIANKASKKMRIPIWIKCFSLVNTLKAFRVSEAENRLSCLHGVRFLSVLSLVISHFFFNMHFVIGDLIKVNLKENWSAFGSLISLSPDTFFLLSGLLVAYQFFRGVNKDVKFNLQTFYFKRYLRIVPTVMLSCWFHGTVFTHLGSGPLWDYGEGSRSQVASCQRNWWANVLCVQNFLSSTDQCNGWTWQGGAEMQFYMLSPIYLFALKRSEKYGFTLIGITIGLSAFITGLTIYVIGITDFSSMMGFLNWIHVKPWCRISPYMIGLLLGYILVKHENSITKLSNITINVCNCIAVLLCSLIFILPFKLNLATNLANAVAFGAFQKSFWSLAVGWLIFACIGGKLQILNAVLTWTPLVLISKISYSINVVHPLLLRHGLLSTRNAIKINAIDNFYTIPGYLCWICAFSLIFYVIIEAPTIEMGRLITGNTTKRKAR